MSARSFGVKNILLWSRMNNSWGLSQTHFLAPVIPPFSGFFNKSTSNVYSVNLCGLVIITFYFNGFDRWTPERHSLCFTRKTSCFWRFVLVLPLRILIPRDMLYYTASFNAAILPFGRSGRWIQQVYCIKSASHWRLYWGCSCYSPYVTLL